MEFSSARRLTNVSHIRFFSTMRKSTFDEHEGDVGMGSSGRREVTASHTAVRCAWELKAQGLTPADIGKIIGASGATVYRPLPKHRHGP